MASPVVSALATLTTAWEAATPPDRTAITYHRMDGRAKRAGVTGDRGFSFGRPTFEEIVLQCGASRSVRWTVPCEVRLSQVGRSDTKTITAELNEAALLEGICDNTSSWPAGVIEVAIETLGAEADDENSDSILAFELRVWTTETDS